MWIFTIETASGYKVVEIQNDYLDYAYNQLLKEVDERFDIISISHK